MSTSGTMSNAVLATWPDEVMQERGEFKNCPLIDFSLEENAQAMKAALEKVRSEFGRTYPLIIGGREVMTEAKLPAYNPAVPSELVGTFAKAGQEEAEMAIKAASETFETWKWTDPWERAKFSWKAADLMTERLDGFRDQQVVGRSRRRRGRSHRLLRFLRPRNGSLRSPATAHAS